jgi:hypothetical protein
MSNFSFATTRRKQACRTLAIYCVAGVDFGSAAVARVNDRTELSDIIASAARDDIVAAACIDHVDIGGRARLPVGCDSGRHLLGRDRLVRVGTCESAHRLILCIVKATQRMHALRSGVI